MEIDECFSLSCLPSEVIEEVIEHLDLADIAQLRLVSRHFRTVCEPDAWLSRVARWRWPLVRPYVEYRFPPGTPFKEIYNALDVRAQAFNPCVERLLFEAAQLRTITFTDLQPVRAISNYRVNAGYAVHQTQFGPTRLLTRCSIVANAPLDTVYSILTDYTNHPRFNRMLTFRNVEEHIEEGVNVVSMDFLGTYVRSLVVSRREGDLGFVAENWNLPPGVETWDRKPMLDAIMTPYGPMYLFEFHGRQMSMYSPVVLIQARRLTENTTEITRFMCANQRGQHDPSKTTGIVTVHSMIVLTLAQVAEGDLAYVNSLPQGLKWAEHAWTLSDSHRAKVEDERVRETLCNFRID